MKLNLGADGHDFEPLVPELHLPDDHGIRFIFPHAPVRPVSINNGDEMRAWYDFVPHSEHEGSDDILESSQQIVAFIEYEIARGIPSHRILLAGFSQGGVIALATALRYHQRLCGVLALSTYLHDFTKTESERTDENLAIPIMRAATSRQNLIRLGYDVRWYDYPMGHQVCLEEVEEIARFFAEVF